MKDCCGFDFRNCFLRSSTAFISLTLSGVITVDLREVEDFILPPDTDFGLYSGVYGIGGGWMNMGSAECGIGGGRVYDEDAEAGAFKGPNDFGRLGSCRF